MYLVKSATLVAIVAHPPVILLIEETINHALVEPETVGCCSQISPVPLASCVIPITVPVAAVRTMTVLKTKNQRSLWGGMSRMGN